MEHFFWQKQTKQIKETVLIVTQWWKKKKRCSTSIWPLDASYEWRRRGIRPLASPSVSPDFLWVRSNSSWLAARKKFTKLDWWPSADTEWPLACCWLRGGQTHKKRLLSPSLSLRSSAHRPGGDWGWMGVGGLVQPPQREQTTTAVSAGNTSAGRELIVF